MKPKQKSLYASLLCLTAFVLWTILVHFADVRPIGPQGSSVGFSALNGWFHHLTGVHMALYTVTDWLGLVPIGVAAGFGALGLIQWIQRKSLLKVDKSLFVLGGFYLAVGATFLLFEVLAVNCRPVLIEGRLEASYPSSTTLLVVSVMPTVIFEICRRNKNVNVKSIIRVSTNVFCLFMVLGRLFSGVHWFTDICGALLLGTGLFCVYRAVVLLSCKE